MIEIDYVKSRTQPQTLRLSYEEFLRMIHEPNTRMAIQQVRDYHNAEAKGWLPGICWQATFEPSYRKEANAVSNGLFALDIDHIGHDEVYQLWKRTEPNLDVLGIVCFHRSPSGDGAHIVALCQEGFTTIAENQAWLAAQLETPYDTNCHDMARLFYISVPEDFYYVDYETLFDQN